MFKQEVAVICRLPQPNQNLSRIVKYPPHPSNLRVPLIDIFLIDT
jgi:hypothetical protein